MCKTITRHRDRDPYPYAQVARIDHSNERHYPPIALPIICCKAQKIHEEVFLSLARLGRALYGFCLQSIRIRANQCEVNKELRDGCDVFGRSV